jgi:hypothetical protein
MNSALLRIEASRLSRAAFQSGVGSDEMEEYPSDPSDYSSEFREEFREAAIAYLAAQFRPGFGRWDCASRGQDYPEDCAICTQCATGNDLICGGDKNERPPLFDTCRPDAPGAAPYLIWEPDDGQ